MISAGISCSQDLRVQHNVVIVPGAEVQPRRQPLGAGANCLISRIVIEADRMVCQLTPRSGRLPMRNMASGWLELIS